MQPAPTVLPASISRKPLLRVYAAVTALVLAVVGIVTVVNPSFAGAAKKVCTGCEVRAECLEYALAHDERFGIWGGLSERERRRLKKAAV